MTIHELIEIIDPAPNVYLYGYKYKSPTLKPIIEPYETWTDEEFHAIFIGDYRPDLHGLFT
jgi:hypothetical protein